MTAPTGRLKVVFLGGAIAVVLSCVFFLACVSSPSSAQVMAFVFTLIAEIVATFCLCVVEGELLGTDSKLFRIGTYSASFAYLFLSLVVALAFILFNPATYGSLIALEVAFLGVLTVIEACFLVAGRSSAKSDSLAQARAGEVADLGARLSLVADRLPESPERKKLLRLVEEIRFFNRNADVDVDADISEKIDQLDKAAPCGGEPLSPDVGRLADELAVLAKRRNEADKVSKRGSF
jgi:hypothetical protein